MTGLLLCLDIIQSLALARLLATVARPRLVVVASQAGERSEFGSVSALAVGWNARLQSYDQ